MSKVRYCDRCGVGEDEHGQDPYKWAELILYRPAETVQIAGTPASPADLCGTCVEHFVEWYVAGRSS